MANIGSSWLIVTRRSLFSQLLECAALWLTSHELAKIVQGSRFSHFCLGLTPSSIADLGSKHYAKV
jgi:hypothetical protein